MTGHNTLFVKIIWLYHSNIIKENLNLGNVITIIEYIHCDSQVFLINLKPDIKVFMSYILFLKYDKVRSNLSYSLLLTDWLHSSRWSKRWKFKTCTSFSMW